MNLGPGAYRDDSGKPYVLKCIRKAEQKLLQQNLNKEYLLTNGDEMFTQNSARLALGRDSAHLAKGIRE